MEPGTRTDSSNSFLPAIYRNYLGDNDVPNIANTFMSGTAVCSGGQYIDHQLHHVRFCRNHDQELQPNTP